MQLFLIGKISGNWKIMKHRMSNTCNSNMNISKLKYKNLNLNSLDYSKSFLEFKPAKLIVNTDIDLIQKKPINLLEIAISDFMLSREAKNCTEKTIELYRYHLKKFVEYLEREGITEVNQIKSRHINAYINRFLTQGLSSSYAHQIARIIRTFVKFLFHDGYISSEIKFEMPMLRYGKQLFYRDEEIQKILKSCKSKREKAFIMLMVDSGIRLSEVLALNWGDIDMNTGVVRIENGKGGKSRTVVIGIEARRALLKYLPEVDCSDHAPVFQTIQRRRFTESGLRSWIRRLSERSGVHITPHALRRTFATVALKSGMDLIRIQQLMGHADLDTTRQYIQVLDEDLINAHRIHSPVEFILKNGSKK